MLLFLLGKRDLGGDMNLFEPLRRLFEGVRNCSGRPSYHNANNYGSIGEEQLHGLKDILDRYMKSEIDRVRRSVEIVYEIIEELCEDLQASLANAAPYHGPVTIVRNNYTLHKHWPSVRITLEPPWDDNYIQMDERTRKELERDLEEVIKQMVKEQIPNAVFVDIEFTYRDR